MADETTSPEKDEPRAKAARKQQPKDDRCVVCGRRTQDGRCSHCGHVAD